MDYTISTDKARLDINLIHDFLSNRSYWAKGRSLKDVKTSIENSICFGLYNRDEQMVGFARVLTDHVVLAYLMDVFILESHRGQGLGKHLIEHALHHSGIRAKGWLLGTADAHSLYEKFGFQSFQAENRYMSCREPMLPTASNQREEERP